MSPAAYVSVGVRQADPLWCSGLFWLDKVVFAPVTCSNEICEIMVKCINFVSF